MPSFFFVMGYIFAMILVAAIWNQSQDLLIRTLSLFMGAAFFASIGAKDVVKLKRVVIGAISLAVLIIIVIFIE